MDEIETLMATLKAQAESTGDAQTALVSTGGWQPIVKNGKTVGRMRFAAMEITVTAPKKAKRKKKAQPAQPQEAQ